MRIIYRLFLLCSLFASAVFAEEGDKVQKVKLQLQWKYQFEFAGFIMAKELGYYREEGLDVDILEYDNVDPLTRLLKGEVDYAVSNSVVSVHEGKLDPFTLIASYFQRSALVLVTQKDIKSVLDLSGKKVMMSRDERTNSILSVLLNYYGINDSNAEFVDHIFSIDDFIAHRVDAMSAFRSNELYLLDQKGAEYNVIDPAEYGIFTNSVNLFTTQKRLENDREEIDRFLKATRKGWEYAISHIPQTAKLIHEKYQPRKSIGHLVYEGEVVRKLMLLDLYGIGEINGEFVQYTYKQFVKSKILKDRADSSRLIYETGSNDTKNSASLKLSSEERAWIAKNPVVSFAGDPNWLPYEAFDEAGNYTGIVADHLKLIENMTGLKFKAVQVASWHETLSLAAQKKVKVVSGDGADTNLKKNFDHTVYYDRNPIVIIMNKDHNYVDRLEDIADHRIAIVKDYGYTADIRSLYPQIDFIEVNNIQEGLEGVAQGKYDAMLETMALATYNLVDRNLNNLKIVGKTPVVMNLTLFVSKDEPILHSILNKAFKQIDQVQKLSIAKKWYDKKFVKMIDYDLVWQVSALFLLILIITLYWNRRLSTIRKRLDESVRELELSSIRYQSVVESTQDGFLMLDRQGMIMEVNPAYCAMSGYTKEDLVGSHVSVLENSESIEETRSHTEDIIRNGGDIFDTIHVKKNGDALPVEASVSYADVDGGRIFTLIRDRTDQLFSENLAHLRHELSRMLFHGDKESLLTKALDNAEAVTGSQIGFYHFVEEGEEEVSLQVWSTNTLEKMCFAEGNSMHYPISQAGIWVECIYKRKPMIYNDYESHPHKKGLPEGHAKLTRFITVPIIRNERIVAIIGVGNKKSDYNEKDVEMVKSIGHLSYGMYEKKLAEQRIEFLAYHDPLTRLPNRTLLTDRIGQILAYARQNNDLFAVCYLDLDSFKPINDLYGHQMGDLLLQHLSDRLGGYLREGDTIARLGGDEFVFILTNIRSKNECEQIVQDILDLISVPFEIEEVRLHVSGSIGITLYPEDDTDSDGLLRHADQAMYDAKSMGKSTYSFYRPQVSGDVHDDKLLLEEFIHALRHNELLFHFQPKISLNDGKISGFESLIRWEHPRRGLLYPNQFLYVIEGTPYEMALGEYVIVNGLAQLQTWVKKGLDVHISVNISPKQVHDRTFVEFLCNELKKYPEGTASKLEIEILEMSSIKDIARVSKVMEECSKLGVKFSLDDFGTGYASLSHFHQLPIDIVKIDQNFIRDILDNPHGAQIVKGIVEMAKRLDRPVVAEGVESIEIGMLLYSYGCEYAQGYSIAKPMPGGAIDAWMKSWEEQELWHNLQTYLHYHTEIELNIAIFSHKLWMEKFMESIRKKTSVTVPEHTQCQFYRWYKGIGKEKYIDNQSYAFIQKVHYDVHRIGKEVEVLMHNGDDDMMEKYIDELNGKSRELTGILEHLR